MTIIKIIAEHYRKELDILDARYDASRVNDRPTFNRNPFQTEITVRAITHFENIFKGIKINETTLNDMRADFIRILYNFIPKVDYKDREDLLDTYKLYLEEVKP
jgi:hypothetical protein